MYTFGTTHEIADYADLIEFFVQFLVFQLMPYLTCLFIFFYLVSEINENFGTFHGALYDIKCLIEDIYMTRYLYFGDEAEDPIESMYYICVLELRKLGSMDKIETRLLEIKERLEFEIA